MDKCLVEDELDAKLSSCDHINMNKMTPQVFFIDISSTCNLSCPSCAQGNYSSKNKPSLMKKELFQAIVEKIARDYGVSDIHLYNWGEPFLHPQLPEFVELIARNGGRCYLSSNLNVMPNIEAVLSAKPAGLRISCSGFRQETYGVTHRHGNIEKVKANMELLSAAVRKTGVRTSIHVFYHRYLHNLDEEYPMKCFALRLGFGFHPVWAHMMPAEKVLAYVDPQAESQVITPGDRELIARLALPLDAAIACARRYQSKSCDFRTGQMVLDTEGDVHLCCVVYDRTRFAVGNFLSQSRAELQAAKNNHAYCARCMRHGIHIYEMFGAYEFDRLAADHIPRRYSRRLSMRWERMKKTIFLRLIPSRYKGWCYNLYARLVKF